MANDRYEKWVAPTSSSEVARALVQARGAMIELNNCLVEFMAGNVDEAKAHLSKFREHDAEFKAVVTEIGGFELPTGE